MKLGLNIFLILASVGLIYLLVETIRKPITFTETRTFREEHVRERLKQTAELQKLYKSLRGTYAPSFDSLKYVLTNDTFSVLQIVGDKYDSTTVQKTALVKLPAKDSLMGFIRKSPQPKMTVDQFFEYIRFVPFSNGKEFSMQVGQAIVEGTDSLMTPTFEIGTAIGTYLPEFDSASHVIYDPDYNPSKLRKIGDLYKPTTNGNW